MMWCISGGSGKLSWDISVYWPGLIVKAVCTEVTLSCLALHNSFKVLNENKPESCLRDLKMSEKQNNKKSLLKMEKNISS